MVQPLIHNHLLNGLHDIIVERGGDANALALEAGLDGSIFNPEECLIPYEMHNRLLELTAERLSFPELGLEIARRQTVSVFGPLFTLVANQPSVQESLELFSKHLQIRAQELWLTIETSEGKSCVAPRSGISLINDSQTFEDHALGLAWRIIQILHGGSCKLRAVYFKHPEPDNSSAYTQFFKCPVAFNHHCCELVLDPALLQAPTSPDAQQLPQLLRRHLEQKHDDRLINQVKDVITSLLVTGNCTINEVAPAMGYSTRTLQRHLKQEGATFQALVDAVRHQQAQLYLERDNYRLTDIAALLGYSELSAFTRSFKRWFGLSPQKWRKTLSATQH
ncbi:MAG: AraC family transcriptional regulator ligand-binding domain-containing protein [Cellvibrionaceae bacterium]